MTITPPPGSFLAVDFHKATWGTDILAFLQTCRQHDVAADLERSQSGPVSRRAGYVAVITIRYWSSHASIIASSSPLQGMMFSMHWRSKPL